MGIEADAREQPWGIVRAEAPMIDIDAGGSTWPPSGGTLPPPDSTGGGMSHPQVMSRVSLGL